MTVIYLIRHGETFWNREERVQGHIDIGLNERGQWQAEQLGQYMSNRRLDAVISSDLIRAADTAQAVAKAHKLEVQLDAKIRERNYGVMQGMLYADLKDKFPRHFEAWMAREIDYVPDEGESLQQFYERVKMAALAWAKQYEGLHIALVAHGGVLDCLHRVATGLALNAPRNFEILNASLNTLGYQNGQLSITQWGDVSFLQSDRDQPSKSLDEFDGSPKWA